MSTLCLTPESTTALKQLIDDACTGPTPVVPEAMVKIVDSNNNTIFSHASGGQFSAHPMLVSTSTTFKAHSCTKILGGVVTMQFVEKGLISLDDSALIDRLLPELVSKKILIGYEADDRTPIFENRCNEITVRMLLNHTNGTSHSFFNPLLNRYLNETVDWGTVNESANVHATILASPLLSQPGTRTEYGQGFDWLALLISRLLPPTESLGQYLNTHIFTPLGLRHTGFESQYGGTVTSDPATGHLFQGRSIKLPNGTYADFDTPDPPRGTNTYTPLSTGLVSSVSDLCRLYSAIFLNAGTDPISGTRILSPSSVDEITTPQLPEELRNHTRVITSAIPGVIVPRDLSAAEQDPEGSFGFGCAVQGAERRLADGRKGRSEGSVFWYGAGNTEFWVDFDKGVVGVLAGNYVPWNDNAWVGLVSEVEGGLYGGSSG